MLRFRISIAGLVLGVIFSAVVFAAIRSGSDAWSRSIYTMTLAILGFSAVASRHRGVFWSGFAIFGTGYFLVGFGPWIAGPPGAEGRGLNRNLSTTVIVEYLVERAISPETPPPGSISGYYLMREGLKANLRCVVHCALSVSFAAIGGCLARGLGASSRRRARPASPPFEPFSDVD